MEDKFIENTEREAVLFAALADPTRLRILKLLCGTREGGSLCVNALAGILGITQSAVSQHLRVLRTIGLVTGERTGYYVHYSVNHETLQKCQEVIRSITDIGNKTAKCCQNNCNQERKNNASQS